MDDLKVPAGPGIPHGLVVPGGDLTEQFSRSSGPGGQHVNTSDSRVQLSIDLGSTTVLTEAQRQRVIERLSAKLSGTVLTVSSDEQRSQLRNRNAARQRLAELLREALAPPVARRATKPSRNSRRRRTRAERR
ncbi:MAG: aminoacyl-tRNA hydrolase, partial [Brevibacterium sp.]|nr:aminoacyl-tRNA hydrolase [Brevibacterium sp.]